MLASTTAVALFNVTSAFVATSSTAFLTSESFPTPDGSIKIRSGWYFSNTSCKDAPKSPTKEQQIHPEFISFISMPASFKKPPSIPICPNSFSIKTTCSPFNDSFNNFLIRVVFPAPKKPETISIFVILYTFLSSLFLHKLIMNLNSFAYATCHWHSEFSVRLIIFQYSTFQ